MPGEAAAITTAELQQCTLFADMALPDLDRLATLIRTQSYDRGEVVIEFLSRTSDVFLLLEGRLLVNRFSASGTEVGYGRMTPICYFGELAAFDGAPRSVNIAALTPSRLGRIPAAAFKSMIATTPSLADALLIDMANRIRDLSNRLYESSAVSVPGRLEAELTRMAVSQGVSGDGGVIEGMPTHAELATVIGGQRETITRALGRLVDLGIVAKKGRSLVILDFDGLIARTEDGDG